ncbi:hypothetical protein V6N13_040402 [Hibiscus sabdariffa]
MLSTFLSIFLGFFLFDAHCLHLDFFADWRTLNPHSSCLHGLISAAFFCNGDRFRAGFCIGSSSFLQALAAAVFRAVASFIFSEVLHLQWPALAVGFFGCRSWTAPGFGSFGLVNIRSLLQTELGRDFSVSLDVKSAWVLGLTTSFHSDGWRSWRRRSAGLLIALLASDCPGPSTHSCSIYLRFVFAYPYLPVSGANFGQCFVYRYRWRAARARHGECRLNPPFFAEQLSVRIHVSLTRGLTRILSDPPQPPHRTPTIRWSFGPFWCPLVHEPWSAYLIRVVSPYTWWPSHHNWAAGDFCWPNPTYPWVILSLWMAWVDIFTPSAFSIRPAWHDFLFIIHVHGFTYPLCLPFTEWWDPFPFNLHAWLHLHSPTFNTSLGRSRQQPPLHGFPRFTSSCRTLAHGFLRAPLAHDPKWGRRAVSYLNPSPSFCLASLEILVAIFSLPAFHLLCIQLMDSEILNSMENLHFTEEESESVIIEPNAIEEEDSSLWLVGSVITKQPVKGEEVCRIFRSVWKTKNVSEITELCPNFFLIKPVSVDAKTMILNRQPWVLDDDLFSIVSYNPAWSTQQPKSRPRKRQGIEFFSPSSTQQPSAPVPGSSPAVSLTDQASGGTPTGTSNNLNAAASNNLNAAAASGPVSDHIVGNARLNAAGAVDKAQPSVDDAVIQTVAPAPPDPSPVINVTACEGHEQMLAAGKVVVCHAAVVSELVGSKCAVELQLSEEGKDIEPVLPSVTSAAIGATPARAKRSLQGKYEVCTPFQPKRTRLQLSDSDNKLTGMSSIISPTEVAEMSGQPRRAS